MRRLRVAIVLRIDQRFPCKYKISKTHMPSLLNPGRRTTSLYSDGEVSTDIQVSGGGAWQRNESYGARLSASSPWRSACVGGVKITGASGAGYEDRLEVDLGEELGGVI